VYRIGDRPGLAAQLRRRPIVRLAGQTEEQPRDDAAELEGRAGEIERKGRRRGDDLQGRSPYAYLDRVAERMLDAEGIPELDESVSVRPRFARRAKVGKQRT
jgi:hypothetical protein